MTTINEKEFDFIDEHYEELKKITGDDVIGFVYESKNYESFKFMDGNRKATPSRVGVLARSFDEHGMYRCPAIVNDNKEVVDGEGRKGAAEIAELPYVYVVDSNAGADAMGVLNVAQKNWVDTDWVHFYATKGIESYKMLERFIEKYPSLKLSSVIVPTLRDNFTSNAQTKKGPSSVIGGEFKNVISEEDADKLFTWASEIEPDIKKIKGNTGVFLRAAMFCAGLENVDERALAVRISEFCNSYKEGMFVPAKTLQCVDQIQEIYNSRRKTNKRVNMDLAYRTYLSETNPSAAVRWC